MKICTALDLGKTYRDSITGFEGVCTGLTVYLNGCIQALIESPTPKPDGETNNRWLDEQRLTTKPVATAGGPQPTPPGMPH